jgi:hypothetical protein
VAGLGGFIRALAGLGGRRSVPGTAPSLPSRVRVIDPFSGSSIFLGPRLMVLMGGPPCQEVSVRREHVTLKVAHGAGPDNAGLVTVNMLLAGYAYAIHRLEAATGDPRASFRAVFEALNWATSIDDRIRQHWVPEGQPLDWEWRKRVSGAEVMPGVRFARNRVHHHWADAIYLDGARWRWRALGHRGAGADDRGSDVYVEQLEDQPVELALLRLGLAFERVGEFLEPPRPTPHRASG